MNNNTPPFEIGQKVVALNSFVHVRKEWGFNYPYKDDIVEVLFIRKHPKHSFWLIEIPGCEVELCHTNFAPYNPYIKLVSKELAAAAMNVGDTADTPVKEIVNN